MGTAAFDRIDGSMMDNESYFDPDITPPDHEHDDQDDTAEYGGFYQQDMLDARRKLWPLKKGAGYLLEEPDQKKIYKHIAAEVKAQEPLAKNRAEAKKHWDYVRGGAQFSVLEKNEDLSVYKQMFPPGVDTNPTPVPNKVADLIDKIINQILVDPPLPNPKVDSPEDDHARAAADLMKRFLRQNGSPQGTNDLEVWRECLNINITQKSAFVYVWVDERGDGWRPTQIRAHPEATDPANPFLAPDGSTEGERVLRYVKQVQDPTTGQMVQQFTRDASEAERQWMPKIKRRVLTPAQVRVLPRSENLANANGCVLLMWESLSQAKRRFPILRTLSQEQLKGLCQWKPERWKDIVPEALRARHGLDSADSQKLTDNTFIFWYARFCKSDEDYEDGAEVCVNGHNGGFLLKRETMRVDVEIDDGTTRPVVRRIPVAQFIALQDARKGDPFGAEPVQKFSGSNELYAHMWMGILVALEKGLNPLCFLPSTSPVSREDMMRRDSRPIEVLSRDDMPTWEQPPSLPSFTLEALNAIEINMNSEAGTNETSNNLDSRYAVSGVAKNVAIRQAKVSLASYWQNTAAGIVQTWQIYAEHAQCYYKAPQTLMQTGSSLGAFKQRWWVGSDLTGVSEIPIDAGTFTMMAPGEKLAILQTFQANRWMTEESSGEAARAVQMDDLGLQPDPHREQIDNQIAQWTEGPPPDFMQKYQQRQQQAQGYQLQVKQATDALVAQGMNPQQAQQQAQQQVPQPPPVNVPTCFIPRPNDEEPGIALLRVRALSRIMSTPEYAKQPKEWRADVDQAYAVAFAASGGQTVKQQQQVAQQQQQKEADEKAAATAKAKVPAWDEVVADVTTAVIGKMKTAVANEITVLEGDKGKGDQAAADIAKHAADTTKGQMDLLNKREQRGHDAAESEKERQHQHAMATQGHHQKVGEQVVGHHLGGQRDAAKAQNASLGAGAIQPTEPGLGVVPTSPGT